MYFDVKVSGIPKHIKLDSLVLLFSNVLSMRSSEFLVCALPSKWEMKNVLLSLPTLADAQTAQEKLNNFVYMYQDETYVFEAVIDSPQKQGKKSKSKFKNKQLQSYKHMRQYGEGNSQDRSCSAQYRNASSKLDMKIEILRKQKMILEEEQRLLEEQAKLDNLKMESSSRETPSPTVEFHWPGLSSDPSLKSELKQPNFQLASGVLLRKMHMFVKKHSSSKERPALVTHLLSIILQRMATVVALNGQGVYQTSKIISLYRLQYPVSDDEDLVKQALTDVKGLSTDSTGTVQASVSEANAEENSDHNESATNVHTIQKGKENAKDNLSGDLNQSVMSKKKANKIFDFVFYKTSKVLIRIMFIHINKHSPSRLNKLLLKYLRVVLKRRLTSVVAGRHIFQVSEIVKLYRSEYPDTEDEELIKQLVKDIDVENLVHEDIMNTIKKYVTNSEPDENKSCKIDNKTSQVQIHTGEEVTSPLEINEGVHLSKNTENKNNTEKNSNIIEALENLNKEENNADSTTGIGLNEKNVEKASYNAENNSLHDTEHNLVNDADNNAVNDMKNNSLTDLFSVKSNILDVDSDTTNNVVATVGTENCDYVKENIGNRGVKRKYDECENSSIKITETGDEINATDDNIVAGGPEIIGDSDLEDY